MSKKYTHAKKERLVNKINKLTNKEHLKKVLKIIKDRESEPMKDTGHSTVMFFHNLNDETYTALDKYIKSVTKKVKKSTPSSASAQEYVPYSNDEFPMQKHLSPNLKLSNRERNILKKTKYDRNLMEENGSDIVYAKFSFDNLTDTETDKNAVNKLMSNKNTDNKNNK